MSDIGPVDTTVQPTQDPSSMDRQLQRIHGVENTWTLPTLPDDVKLDLISHPALPDENAIGNFLYGLQSDLESAVKGVGDFAVQPAAAATITQQPTIAQAVGGGQVDPFTGQPYPTSPLGPEFQPPSDTENEIRKAWYGIAGLPAPEVVTPNAVEDFKIRAVGQGLLPQNTPIDGSWDPQLNAVSQNMTYDDATQRILGDRPGAVKTSTVLDLMDKWLNPVNLGATAVALNFLPNVNAIQANVQDFSDSHNPLDLLKAGANIALPVINDILLFSGVSEVVAAGRAAEIANEARVGLAGVEAANDLAQPLTLAQKLNPFTSLEARAAGQTAGEVGRFQTPSWIAQRLQPSLGVQGEEAARSGVFGAAGDALASWRQATASYVARKSVQQAMRMGIAGNVETTLFPGFSGVGFGGSDLQINRSDRFSQSLQQHPVFGPLANVLALPLMPTNVYEPGVFTGPVKSLVSHLTTAVSAVPNLTALNQVWYTSMIDHLNAVDPAAAQKVVDAAKNSTPGEALLAHIGNGDKQVAGEIMSFVTSQAAAVARAKVNVDMLGITKASDPAKYWDAFYTYLNHSINMMRPIDPTVDLNTIDGVEQVARQRAAAEWPFQSPNATLSEVKQVQDAKYQGVFDALMHEDPAVRADNISMMHDEIASHNANRSAWQSELINQLDPGFMGGYLNGMWTRIGPDEFNAMAGVNLRLQELHALDELKYVNPLDPGWAPSEFAANVPAMLDPQNFENRSKVLTAFGGSVDPQKQHFTGMLLTEPDRQDAIRLIGTHATLQQRLASIQLAEETGLDAHWRTYGEPLVQHLAGTDLAENAGVQALANIAPSDLKTVARGLFPQGGIPSRSKLLSYLDTLRWTAAQGGDPAMAADFIQNQLDDMNKLSLWNKFGIDPGLSLPDRVKALTGNLPHIAGRVEVPPDVEQYLAQRGFKPVAGVDFMFPHDMVDLNGPFGELRKADLRKISLGRFLSNQDPNISMMRRIAFERELHDRLGGGQIPGLIEPNAGELPFAPGSADQQYVWERLQEKSDAIRSSQTLADQQRSGRIMGSLATAITNNTEPHSPYEFTLKQLHDLFDSSYGEQFAPILKGVLGRSKNLGWEYEGLTALETKLRGNSWLKQGLQVFGKSEASDSLGEWNGVKRVGAGVLGGALGYAATGDPRVAAAGAAGGAAIGPNPRVLAGVIGGGLTADFATQQGMDPGQAALLGLGAGVGGVHGLKLATPKLLDLFGDKAWLEYSKLGEGLATLRDAMRFSLNPFFDMRRYVKNAVRGVTADLPEGYTVGLTHGLNQVGDQTAQADMITRFREAAHPWFDAEKIDEMSRFSSDRGILGFSPTRDMAGMFAQLVNQGMDDAQAASIVGKTLTYGGRIGLEKSVNFVFFPFSFEKKVLTQLARFAADDLGRTVILHDAVKAYDVLNNNYDLTNKLKDHIPLLDEVAKLNMFTNGISPGEFGGVNRPLIEAAQVSPLGSASASVLNMFLPQGFHIDAGTDTDRLQQMMQRLIPAYRDTSMLLQNAAEQGHVLFSPEHLTSRAEVSDAYSEWDQFKSGVEQFGKAHHISWDQMMRSPQYANMRNYIETKRADLDSKYPAWQTARVNAAAKATALQNELTDIKVSPRTEAELELSEFAQTVDAIDKKIFDSTGASFKQTPDSVPPEMYTALRSLALQYSRLGNGFENLYDRFYAPMLGPIEQGITG